MSIALCWCLGTHRCGCIARLFGSARGRLDVLKAVRLSWVVGRQNPGRFLFSKRFRRPARHPLPLGQNNCCRCETDSRRVSCPPPFPTKSYVTFCLARIDQGRAPSFWSLLWWSKANRHGRRWWSVWCSRVSARFLSKYGRRAEWNVLTKGIPKWEMGKFNSGSVSISLWTRSLSSLPALLVKVIARISCGATPSLIRWRMRWLMVLVLPAPAPAKISKGPLVWSTASFCFSFKSLRWCTRRV